MTDVYVGLDLETSGTDIDAGTVPIQVGVSLGASVNLALDIGWPFEPAGILPNNFHGPATWSEDAEKVHGISVASVCNTYHNGDTASSVDARVTSWLTDHAIGPREAVLVGWNVGSFDFPFVRRYLPRTAALCSYRFVDLNSVVFTLAEHGRRRAQHAEHAFGAKAWKRRAKAVAAREIGGEARWHDAGYDALASLLAWYWLCDQIETRER